MIKRKVKTFKDRLVENNMFYRPGDKIRVKSKQELIESGMSTREVRAIKHLCNRVLIIKMYVGDGVNYILENTETPLCDSDIKGYVL